MSWGSAESRAAGRGTLRETVARIAARGGHTNRFCGPRLRMASWSNRYLPDQKLRGREPLNTGFEKGLIGCFHGSGQANCAAGIFEYEALEVQSYSVNSGVPHAEVVSETAEEEAPEAALAEIASETGRSGVVVFKESRVRVDVAAESLANDELCVRKIQGGMKGRAGGCLNAVIGPESLLAVLRLDRLVRVMAGVRRRERDVPLRMPILREDHMLKPPAQLVDDRYDLIAPIDRKGAAGAEVILEIDDKQNVSSRAGVHVSSLAREGGRGPDADEGFEQTPVR